MPSELAKSIWARNTEGREGYCSHDLQDAAMCAIDDALRMAREAVVSAKLPEDYIWSDGNQSKFYFGVESATDALDKMIGARG